MDGQAEKKRKRNKEVLEYVDTVLMAVITIALCYTFLVRVVRVDGSSMNPTLLDGERLLAVSLFYTPQQGDVVIVDAYIPHGRPLVKRVIGVAGDVIDIDFTQGVVYRNGEALEEPYTAAPTLVAEGMVFPLTVPEGTVFLMGDNRNRSKDSRDPEIGCVDVRDILGKAVWTIAPLNRMGAVQ